MIHLWNNADGKTCTQKLFLLCREAAELLGLMIRNARIERNVTVVDVAARAVISRCLVHRIEDGEMGSSIGAAL